MWNKRKIHFSKTTSENSKSNKGFFFKHNVALSQPPPIHFFVFIPRTSSINIRPCSQHAAHNCVASVISMRSFMLVFKAEMVVGSTCSGKSEHSACYGTQWMIPLRFSLLVWRVLLLKQHAPSATIIVVNHSILVLNKNFLM